MRYAGATWKAVSNYTVNGMRKQSLGLILHVQQGDNLAGVLATFNRRSSQASAHFWIGKGGETVQMVDTANRAWAQGDGNDDYLSVETEGWVAEPLTSKQLLALAALYEWGMGQFSWPKRLAERPGQMGFGYHAMGGAAWGNHPCPGPIRIGQRAAVLALINNGGDWFAMATKDELKEAIREVLREDVIQNDDGPGRVSILTALYRAYSQSRKAVIKLGA